MSPNKKPANGEQNDGPSARWDDFPSLGNQIGRALKRIKDKPFTVLALSAILSATLIAAAVAAYPETYISEAGAYSAMPARTIGKVLAFVFMLVSTLPIAAFAYGMAYRIRGGKPLAFGIRRVPAVLLTILAAAFTVLVPLIIVIPGIIMLVRFSLALPVIVVERRSGFDALLRSRDLVKGFTRQLFMNLTFMTLTSFLILGSTVIVGVTAASSDTGSSLTYISLIVPVLLFSFLIVPLFQSFLQVTYEDLAKIKGAPQPPALAGSFASYRKMAVLGLLVALGLSIYSALTPDAFDESESLKAPPPKVHVIGKKTNDDSGSTKTAKTNEAKNRDWQRYQDITKLRLALNSYYTREGRYPDSLEDLVPQYIAELPQEPGGGSYRYARNEGTFTLDFNLEEGVAALKAGLHSLSPEGFVDLEPASQEVDLSAPAEEQPTNEPVPASSTQTTSPSSSPTTTRSSSPAPATSTSSSGTSSPQSSTPAAPAESDRDNDGLSDDYEAAIGTNPDSADTDGDGIIDPDEISVFGTDPTLADTDGDGVNDASEISLGTDPNVADTANGDESNVTDTDSDGLADEYEHAVGTSASNPDTDGDGLADGDELLVFGTNPLSADTDLDGISDSDEIANGTNPLYPESSSYSGGSSSGSSSYSGYSGGGGGGGGGGGVTVPTYTWIDRTSVFSLHEPSLSTLGYWHPAMPGLF